MNEFGYNYENIISYVAILPMVYYRFKGGIYDPNSKGEHELIRDKQDSILEFVTLLNFFLSKNIGFFIFDDNSIWFRSSQILINNDEYIDGRTKEILFSSPGEALLCNG